MIELKKYQCEHCGTIYNEKSRAGNCEAQHIEYNKLQIVRAVHEKCNNIENPEGKWPDYIIVGKNELQEKLIRYKFDSEETTTGPFLADSYYNPANK